MDQERKFLSALQQARQFQVHPLERRPILLDADKKSVLKLAAN